MASTKKVAVVTGSNKGIGFAIVRALCKQFDGDVFLTARSEERGQEAMKALQAEGLNPKFHQLDIDDKSSIDRLHDFLKEQYGGLDVLVNNAGIAFKQSSTAPFSEQATVTINTNFTSTVNVCNKLFPLLRPHARVSNVSSFVSNMGIKKCSKEIQARFKDPALTIEGLQQLMNEFVSLAQTDSHQAAGWPDSAYGVSKIGVTVMSMVQQRQLDAAKKDDIIVNACCPGYVDTDMTSHKGKKTIDQGAETPVMAALIPANAASPRGQFLSEKKVEVWG
ncbi:carbonyl reductase [NADPH] 1-like [Babylonia areolata]|uniref:carbonyl reductase [NADPH] 1-like n=1 Tax=Babylonia areolata TaxID=304850 RepID=UPI003FCFE659